MGVIKKFFKRKRNARDLRNLFLTFFKFHSAGGILLMICTAIALFIANNSTCCHFYDYLDMHLGFTLGDYQFNMTLLEWINDGLMAIFFFVVGLEIKREVLVGELSSPKQAALPIFAALGGMVVPAVIYLFFNRSGESAQGWGIPVATDIAFAIGILSMLGKRVPLSLKIFLTALAIVDDLGAIVVLAIFYPTGEIKFDLLIIAFLILGVLLIFNSMRVRRAGFYIIPGIVVWLLFLGSGVHATISGVLLAMTIPGRTTINEVRFIVGMRYLLNKFSSESERKIRVLANSAQQQAIHSMHFRLNQVHPLMIKLEHNLHPWVTFIIMPLFALANAGVAIDLSFFELPLLGVVPGIFFGLLIGKPLGIFLASWLVVKLKIADLPKDVKWIQILSIGVVAGIGFTMSLFIDNLAFTDITLINTGKITILFTSFVAAVLGLIALSLTNRNKNTNQ